MSSTQYRTFETTGRCLSAFFAMQQLPKLPKINIPDVKLPKDLFNQLLEGTHHGDAILSLR